MPDTDPAQVLKTFSDQMRSISSDYRKCVETAESLAERDVKAEHERANALEAQFEEALAVMEDKDREIEERERRISELQNTVRDIASLLGTFIQNNMPSWVDTINEPRTQQVLHIIADYQRNSGDEALQYLRVPEETLKKYAADLGEARNLVGEYRKVLHGQGAMIKDQSRNLDAYVQKYENSIKFVKQKEHEILLLVQQSDDLGSQLQECRAVLSETQEIAAEAENTSRRYEELRGNMESLKTAHELELDQRDAEIANLRQKLGSAREEVFARREDVKTVVAQTQAILHAQPDPHTVAAKSSNASKALRFFGMERDRYKKATMPGSQSSLGLSSLDARYSTKEVAPAVGKETLRHRPSLQTHTNPRAARTTQNTPVDGSPGFTDARWTGSATRPRSGSLEHIQSRTASPSSAQCHEPALPSPVDKHKPLPDRPLTETRVSSARLAGITSSIESPLQAQITSDYLSHGIMGQTSQSARRVLSKITEASSHASLGDDHRLSPVRDENESDHSISNSDREVYRKSICALDMLNSSTGLPYNETETDIGRVLRVLGMQVQDPEVHRLGALVDVLLLPTIKPRSQRKKRKTLTTVWVVYFISDQEDAICAEQGTHVQICHNATMLLATDPTSVNHLARNTLPRDSSVVLSTPASPVVSLLKNLADVSDSATRQGRALSATSRRAGIELKTPSPRLWRSCITWAAGIFVLEQAGQRRKVHLDGRDISKCASDGRVMR